MTNQKKLEEIREILGIYMVAPHASPDGVTFNYPRCGDCWCTIQEVHTHSSVKEDTVLEIIGLFSLLFQEIREKVNMERRIMAIPIPDSDAVIGYNSALNDVMKALKSIEEKWGIDTKQEGGVDNG